MSEVREYQLYGHDYCSLCKEMEQQLEKLQGDYNFRLTVIDIEEREDLFNRFSDVIPLLFNGEQEICRHRFDEEAFLKSLL